MSRIIIVWLLFLKIDNVEVGQTQMNSFSMTYIYSSTTRANPSTFLYCHIFLFNKAISNRKIGIGYLQGSSTE